MGSGNIQEVGLFTPKFLINYRFVDKNILTHTMAKFKSPIPIETTCTALKQTRPKI